MNKTKIEWTDYSINPIVGCYHNCDYCYAIKQAKRQKHRCKLCYQFIPHPHLERLTQIKPTQKPKKIFIDSMWDWNSTGIKREWIESILNKIKECPQHIFQILSKRPIRYSRFKYPNNVWLGTSISTNSDTYRVNDLHKTNFENLKFASIEPIHQKINFYFSKIDWIIIGAETGNRIGKIIPKKEWIESIIENAKLEKIPIFIKDNVKWRQRIQEFPVKDNLKRIGRFV